MTPASLRTRYGHRLRGGSEPARADVGLPTWSAGGHLASQLAARSSWMWSDCGQSLMSKGPYREARVPALNPKSSGTEGAPPQEFQSMIGVLYWGESFEGPCVAGFKRRACSSVVNRHWLRNSCTWAPRENCAKGRRARRAVRQRRAASISSEREGHPARSGRSGLRHWGVSDPWRL